MKYLEMKKGAGPAQNKALGGPTENKAATEPPAGNTDVLEGVQFASPAARAAALEGGLTTESFKRRRKSSDRGYTLDDVSRVKGATTESDEEEDGA